jgi:hypothetical protein
MMDGQGLATTLGARRGHLEVAPQKVPASRGNGAHPRERSRIPHMMPPSMAMRYQHCPLSGRRNSSIHVGFVQGSRQLRVVCQRRGPAPIAPSRLRSRLGRSHPRIPVGAVRGPSLLATRVSPPACLGKQGPCCRQLSDSRRTMVALAPSDLGGPRRDRPVIARCQGPSPPMWSRGI